MVRPPLNRLVSRTLGTWALLLGAGCSGGAGSVSDGGGAAADGGGQTASDGGGIDAAGGGTGRCGVIGNSVAAAGFGGKVTVTCDAKYAYLAADTDPDHVKMTGITGTNDQVPVPAPSYKTPVPLAPARAAKVTTIDAAVGVAVNGVPIYDYSSQGTLDPAAYDPKFDTKLTGELDECGGHSGRGDDYHYHVAPSCMIAAMKNKGPSAILGWGLDGYPLYGDTNPDGSAITSGALDVCNAQPDPTFGYRYHTSTTHPYIIQCLVGEVDLAVAPRVMPLTKQGGGGRPPGDKPPGGVQNLQLVQDANGQRTMSYTHMGQSYFIKYKPSSTPKCWDFEEHSYTSAKTNAGTAVGTYCRP